MIIFACLKKEFDEYVNQGIISNKVYDAYKEKLGKRTKLNQIKAWANSLPFMKSILDDLPDNVGIAIEFNIPLTSKRVDLVISGYDNNYKPVIILFELKQWEYVDDVKNQDAVVKTLISNKEKNSLHPSYQVLCYAELLENYNHYIENHEVKIIPIVYLHNYSLKVNDVLLANKFKKYYKKAPIYGKENITQLKLFIENSIIFGDHLDIVKQIDQSEVKPNKKLLDSLENMIQNNKIYTLLDEQKTVVEIIKQEAKKAFAMSEKRVIIVKGGPGTGKSVVAIYLLGELLKLGLMGAYVSKNMAPRKVYKNSLVHNNEISIHELFKSSGYFFKDPENKYDFLLVDEAHRLQEKSGIHNNIGENQIKEIIHASKLSVFFIDERQMITLKDIGNIANIKYFAKFYQASIVELDLQSQFRCNGSDSYLDFIDSLLYNKRGNYKFHFDFQVLDTPNELRDLIQSKNTSNDARLVAGFCWRRNAKEADNQYYMDITIGDFQSSWNLKHGEPFATRENAINEVGCIHNVQGLEFDYIGVIIGPDLKYQNGKVITDYKERANTEKSLYGLHVLMKQDKEYYEKLADTIIRNTYRVLLTRGLKGCYVYACDPKLQEHLKKIIGTRMIHS
ncbi:putative uncharacterized protein [Mycoplasma sp. CAG:776]|nr:putative uncharacterized protein [Mycoplasma sp. CAG:776]